MLSRMLLTIVLTALKAGSSFLLLNSLLRGRLSQLVLLLENGMFNFTVVFLLDLTKLLLLMVRKRMNLLLPTPKVPKLFDRFCAAEISRDIHMILLICTSSQPFQVSITTLKTTQQLRITSYLMELSALSRQVRHIRLIISLSKQEKRPITSGLKPKTV